MYGRRSTDLLSRSYDPTLAQQPAILLFVHARGAVPPRPTPLFSLAQLATGCSNPLSVAGTGWLVHDVKAHANEKRVIEAMQELGNEHTKMISEVGFRLYCHIGHQLIQEWDEDSRDWTLVVLLFSNTLDILRPSKCQIVDSFEYL